MTQPTAKQHAECPRIPRHATYQLLHSLCKDVVFRVAKALGQAHPVARLIEDGDGHALQAVAHVGGQQAGTLLQAGNAQLEGSVSYAPGVVSAGWHAAKTSSNLDYEKYIRY